MPVPFIKDDFLVCPITINPALDRRFSMLSGGGRSITGVVNGVTYRSPWCRHGWQAQQPTSTKGASNTAYFGCHGYVQDHELVNDFDCGYLEEGYVPNPAWNGVFIYKPTPDAWSARARNVSKTAKTPWPEPDNDIALVSPTTPGSPNKVYYAGQLGPHLSSPSKSASPSHPASPSKHSAAPIFRPVPASPPKPRQSATQTTTPHLRPSGSDMSLKGG
ncbi:hypothetical protein PENSPDRAFT_671091 [Peniophora sp. CONT]|nr:hypothetical protein PENSPDRAFT_671091 [Peniophora sp. CONT]